MPNLNDIVELASALEQKAVAVVADRCVVVRNRNAACRRCRKVCLSGAVTVKGNRLNLDNSLCVGCGACTALCPTEALIPLDPPDNEFFAAVAHSAAVLEDVAVIACARMAAKEQADPSKYASLACLGRIDEGSLLQFAAAGISHLVLVEGNCSTCKYGKATEGLDETIEEARGLIACQGASMQIERSSEFPVSVLVKSRDELYAQARRGFFSRSRKRAAEAVGKTAEVVMLKEFEQNMPSLRERLRVLSSGSQPSLEAHRHMHLLDALDQLGNPQCETLTSRHFASVEIDEQNCTACGMCTVFCPTKALQKSQLKPDDGIGSFLEFQLADCVNCGMCEDICRGKCLKLKSEISTAELFDFEPRLIHIPDPPKSRGMRTGFKRR